MGQLLDSQWLSLGVAEKNDMGTWGVGHFDNDTACDWLYDLQQSNDLSVIERSVNAVLDGEDVTVQRDVEALAAIETIAKLIGRDGGRKPYEGDVDEWVRENPVVVSVELVDKARRALLYVLSDKSELHGRWSESDEFESWSREVESLLNRLTTH